MLRYAVERRFRFLALDQTWLADWFASDLPAHKSRRASPPGWQAGCRRTAPSPGTLTPCRHTVPVPALAP